MRKSPGLRLQTSVVQDNVPVEVAAGLFVGSVHAAFNMDGLKENQITHVLNLAGNYATFPEEFTYLSLRIRDKEYASLLSCLPIAAIFIDAGLKCGGVLVHCSGGRSRSPAVVMAYLMMKQQLSFKTLSAHVKLLRPVVNLNAGFASQLECLDNAHGDVFAAHQEVLKARLAHWVELYKNGELIHELVRKHRPTKGSDAPLRSPPYSLSKKQSSLELLASGCDDRGMVGETVPSGFCLSLPSCASSTHIPTASAPTSFIPALRSMGTIFGCLSCGENLFCAGTIVCHDDEQARKVPADLEFGNGYGAAFLNVLRGLDSKSLSDEEMLSRQSTEVPKKTPLLSKLRLRAHSPRASSTTEIVALTRVSTESSHKSMPSNHTLGSGLKFGVYHPRKTQKELQQPAVGESGFIAKKYASLSESSTNGTGTNRTVGDSMDRLWRSFTSLTTPKHTAKEAIYGKNRAVQLATPTEFPEVQKPRANSTSPRAPCVSAAKCTSEHAAFLKYNFTTWEQRIKLLVSRNAHVTVGAGEGPMSTQLAALLETDSRVLASLTRCEQWAIDPPTWALDEATEASEGMIHCPRETCGVIIGKWRWEGLRCVEDQFCVPCYGAG